MILNTLQAGEGPVVVLLHGLFGAARNFGQVQRHLAPRCRVLALDMRNHGGSPHADGMRYATMAEDVFETLESHNALPAALIGHSMGGKVAMRAALARPDAVTRLAVVDIAPVIYPPRNHPIAAALAAIPLTPSLTRAQADTILAETVDDPAVRAFLLQNLTFGARPGWRIGLSEITAALPDLEGWDAPGDVSYPGRTLFVAGALSDFIRQEDRPTIRSLFPAARFVSVKQAGHWVHADNPAGFIAVIDAFVAAGS